MRPLPRVHAVTDDAICRDADFGIKAASIAAAGSAVALHARAPASTTVQLTGFAKRLTALAAPPEAAVIISGRPDLARALNATGVQLRSGDLSVADARRVCPDRWIGRSVHSEREAREAIALGADYLVLGTIFPTKSHPGFEGSGLGLVTAVAKLGVPIIAIGGITAANVGAIREAGAWGVAVISAVWNHPDPYAATLELLAALDI